MGLEDVMSTLEELRSIEPESIFTFSTFLQLDSGCMRPRWPTVSGFEPREAIQRLCGLTCLGDGQTIGTQPDRAQSSPSSHDLLHLIATRRTSRREHDPVLPYGRLPYSSFKDVGVDLSRETDFEAPTSYDTYDEQSLGRMKFEKAPDGSWIRRSERQLGIRDRCIPEQRRGRDQRDGGWSEGIHVEATFLEPMMTEPSYTVGPSSQPSFTELPHTEATISGTSRLIMRLGWMSQLRLAPLGLV
ncbi:hypothetical protein CK203_064384 [Vitis vinifera]|uniref:Uncharacterized protein n=1 Tax=Vitis vinifera TaxID=29760 RepID=A0A438G6Y5_VITVI|nr:hypothetical protein CK203_064384 [Vitis vinifera]